MHSTPMPPPRTGRTATGRLFFPAFACAALVGVGLIARPAAGQEAAAAAAGQPAGPAAPARPRAAAAERLKLTTSDGFALAAWHYPATQADTDDTPAPPPVVILLHDLGGSHQSLESLARELQSRGISVVAPDLRGHGATVPPQGRDNLDTKSIKKSDFEAMVVTGGGRVRAQASNRGDVEAVREWIRERAEAGKLDMGRLVVVGSGVGAAVAAQWAVADASWPDLASGPQGRDVRGLVLVSPAWATRGFSISPALSLEPVRRILPILVVGGTQDADAVKIYEQLKRQRPDRWNEKRPGSTEAKQAPKLDEAQQRGVEAKPTLWLRIIDTRLSGDRLADYVPEDRAVTGLPADLVSKFLGMVTAPEQ